MGQLEIEHCQLEHTPVAAIQGSGLSSPVSGSQHSIMAVVSHIAPAKGLFVEESLSDGDPATSDALWIDYSHLANELEIGDRVRLAGTVAELGESPHSLTALTSITGYVVCAANQPLPIHETGLPLDAGQREALEGMRVQMQQNLVVTNVRDALTRGQISVALGGRQYSPTEVTAPGSAAAEKGHRNQEQLLTLQWSDYADSTLLDANPDQMLVNDGIFQFSGVLSDARYEYMVLIESLGWLPAVRQRPVPPPRQGNLRISSLNLLSYFNGDGLGGGFPTRRGAKSLQDFKQQRGRLVAAITAMNPDVLGVMEIENDGYGPQSAIQDLVTTLNHEAPDAGWRFVAPQSTRLGGDLISVGILYKSSIVRSMGAANTLDTGTFANRSRQPIMQRFVHQASGKNFMVVVNHFKSKSSCPESGPDSDQGDGQACWNPVRVASADELDRWLNSMRNILDEPRIVVLGDLNATRMEEPIQLMTDRGWIDQVTRFGHQPQHSYNFRGAASSLDYLFTSEIMSADVADARIWPINADYPIGGIENGPEYIRSSDHDPVIADFNLLPE